MDEQFWDRLERDGFLTRSEIAQARARHGAAGGAPDTAICEVRPLSGEDRNRLRRLIARSIDQPIAPPTFLDAPEADALAFLPRDLAERHCVLPTRLTPQLLTVVMAATPARVLAELSFVVGRKVQPYFALESDVRHALARHLGLPLPPRFQALGAPAPTPPPRTSTELTEPAGDSSSAPTRETGLKEVDRGWGSSGRGLPQLRSLRTDETPAAGGSSQPPAPVAPVPAPGAHRDWVAKALESLRAADVDDRLAALGQVGAPGMTHLIYLRRTEAGLAGHAASHGGVPLQGIAQVELPSDPDTIIGRALVKGATRCGPFRDDAAFAPLYAALDLPAPADVLVAPIKRDDAVVGVFVGDHGALAIAPVTASAVRRLLTGLVEFWPETPTSPLGPVRSQPPRPLSAPMPAISAPPAALAPELPDTPELIDLPPRRRAPTAELVSLPPAATPPVFDDAEHDADSSPGMPEWVLPEAAAAREAPLGETLLGMPSHEMQTQELSALELFGPADLAEMAGLVDDPPVAPAPVPAPVVDAALTETRPGLAVLETRPMLPSVTQSRLGALGGGLADTTLDLRPMGLAELVDAFAREQAGRATETLSAVAAVPGPVAHGPLPQLLDLDNMATVPALARVRPSAAAPVPDLPPPPPPAELAPALPSEATEVEVTGPAGDPPTSDAPRPLPFPVPGWTEELPLPMVSATRSVRIESTSMDLDPPAARFAADLRAPVMDEPPTGMAPAPASPSERLTFQATPFDPPSGPMPRVTVTVTPAPHDPSLPPAPRSSLALSAPAIDLEVTGPPAAPAPPRRLFTEGDVKSAIDSLSSPDASVRQQGEDLLLAVGEPVLDAVFAAFPGHLMVDRFAHPVGAPGVESHSSLLRVVVRLGPLATGRLEQLCAHMSPEIRYYAVFCFSTLRSARSLPAVAERLHDGDAGVRDIAVWVLEQYRGQPAFKAVVERLREGLKEGPARRRRPIVDAVGRLHLAEAMPELLTLLGDLSLGLQDPAHKALLEITRADLGLDAWKWQKWLERNGNRPRIEWLLDGLLSDHRAIRSGAFAELRRVTHQNYGYLVDAPPAERRSAHDRWLKWWRDAGMVRFAGYR
jgi:hypothetical protein